MTCIRTAATMAACLLAPAIGMGAQAVLIDLGLATGEVTIPLPLGMSPDGACVVGEGIAQGTGNVVPWRWTAETGMVPIGSESFRTAPEGRAFGASNNGSVVTGFMQYPNGTKAFSWTSQEGVTELSNLPGAHANAAFAVSADGQVIVGWSGSQPCRWTANGGVQGLGYLPGRTGGSASGVSSDGSVVIGIFGSSSGPEVEAFRWTAETGMVSLGDLPGGLFRSYASAVSGNGQVVVGTSESTASGRSTEAFYWSASEGMVAIGMLAGDYTYSAANAVNSDGSIIVGDTFLGSDITPFIWTRNRGIESLTSVLEGDYGLDLAGWDLDSAMGISADGKIITGFGFNPQGVLTPYLVYLDTALAPEPGTMALLGLGALALLRRRK